MLLLEHWKPVDGFEEIYEISNMGRVFSKKLSRDLFPTNHKGYSRVTLRKKSKPVHAFCHRLVAAAFIEQPAFALTVNHKDGQKRNNRPSNLEYLSSPDNTRHAVSIGINNRGVTHGRAKLDEQGALQIRRDKGTFSARELAEIHQVNQATIYRIWTGKLWRHI